MLCTMKWGEQNGMEFWTMPPERAKEALVVLRDGFFTDEAFCCAIGVDEDAEAQKELENLSLDAAADGVSIMAIDKETNRIAGVCYNKIQSAVPPGQKCYFEEFRDSKCKNKTARMLISEMVWVISPSQRILAAKVGTIYLVSMFTQQMALDFDTLVDVYKKYNANCCLEIMFVATHPDFRRRGVATGCVESSLALGSSLTSPKPQIATSIFTSPFSIRVGRKFHFDEIVHVSMGDKFYGGKCSTEHPKIGKHHHGSDLMVKRL